MVESTPIESIGVPKSQKHTNERDKFFKFFMPMAFGMTTATLIVCNVLTCLNYALGIAQPVYSAYEVGNTLIVVVTCGVSGLYTFRTYIKQKA